MSKGLIGFIFSLVFCPLGLPSLILCRHYKEDEHPNLALAGFIIAFIWLPPSIYLLALGIISWSPWETTLPPASQSQETTSSPATTPQETTPISIKIDWDNVEIISLSDYGDSWLVRFSCAELHDSPFYQAVRIDKSEYSPEAVKKAIEEEINRKVALERTDEERLRDLQESLNNG